MALLEIADLRTTFRTDDGPVRAVDGVSLSVDAGRVLGVVGESGCGKSATSLSVMGLLPRSATVEGSIRLDGRELVGASQRDYRALRGADMAMIFQDPMTSLNPVMTIGWQLVEAIRLHRRIPKAEARAEAVRGLAAVGIPSPEERLRAYPHELSGGMRQRVNLARCLAQNADVVLMDEPLGALDAMTRDLLHDEIERIVTERDLTVMFVTHNMREAVRLGDRVVLMAYGKVVHEQVVGLPHPRVMDSAAVAERAADLTHRLHQAA